MHATRRTGPRGFTLVELLVVIAIIALISAVALPTVLPALNERRVSESARILQAILVRHPRRRHPSQRPQGHPAPARPGLQRTEWTNPLASNRIIPIESAPDYTEGLVDIVTVHVRFGPNLHRQCATPAQGCRSVFTRNTGSKSSPLRSLEATSQQRSGVPSNPTNVVAGTSGKGDQDPLQRLGGLLHGRRVRSTVGPNTGNSDRFINNSERAMLLLAQFAIGSPEQVNPDGFDRVSSS